MSNETNSAGAKPADDEDFLFTVPGLIFAALMAVALMLFADKLNFTQEERREYLSKAIKELEAAKDNDFEAEFFKLLKELSGSEWYEWDTTATENKVYTTAIERGRHDLVVNEIRDSIERGGRSKVPPHIFNAAIKDPPETNLEKLLKAHAYYTGFGTTRNEPRALRMLLELSLNGVNVANLPIAAIYGEFSCIDKAYAYAGRPSGKGELGMTWEWNNQWGNRYEASISRNKPGPEQKLKAAQLNGQIDQTIGAGEGIEELLDPSCSIDKSLAKLLADEST